MKLQDKNSIKEIVRYLIIGGLTTVIGLVTYYLLTITILDPTDELQLQAANVLTWMVGVTFAYFTNRRYVFCKTGRIQAREMGMFYSGRVGTLLLEMLLMHILVISCGINDKISKIAVQFLVIIGNYLISKLWVFRKSGG